MVINNVEELIEKLVSLSTETEYIEFKRNFSEFDREGADISALANSAAYHGVRAAYKIWGVDDATHEVVGTSFSPRKTKKGNQDLELWLRQRLSSNASFEFTETTYMDKPVVVLKIWPAAHHPVEFQNIAYIRTSSSTQKLQSGSVREAELWTRLQLTTFEAQASAEDLTVEEALGKLNTSAYFDLLGVPTPTSSDTVIHYLQEDGLAAVQDDGRIEVTNLGALLFALNMEVFHTVRRKALRVIRYNGKGRTSPRSERGFGSGYALMLYDAYDAISTMVGSTEEIQGMRRVAASPFPETAVRELIVNALVHQDLTMRGMGPMVEIFDDRIEVTNPGVLLVDPERLVNDPPHSRNENLSALMRRLGFCEEAGSGWDRIIEACEEALLPPPRIYTGESTRITLFKTKEFKQLTLEERLDACYWHACIRYESGEYMSNASLRERFGLKSSNSAQVSRLIKDAVSRNLVKPVDASTSPRYMRYLPFWA